MRSLVLIPVAFVALAACESGPASIPESPDAGPGLQLVTPYDAGVKFAETCLVRGRNFEKATDGVRVHDFTRNSSTGTYYHNTGNLSVKVTTDSCSLVMGTDRPVDDAIDQLARGTASIISNPPPGISVTSREEADGLRYFRLGIKAPVSSKGAF